MVTTAGYHRNPALDFANAILAETNNGLELIEILHDIAQGVYAWTARTTLMMPDSPTIMMDWASTGGYGPTS